MAADLVLTFSMCVEEVSDFAFVGRSAEALRHLLEVLGFCDTVSHFFNDLCLRLNLSRTLDRSF